MKRTLLSSVPVPLLVAVLFGGQPALATPIQYTLRFINFGPAILAEDGLAFRSSTVLNPFPAALDAKLFMPLDPRSALLVANHTYEPIGIINNLSLAGLSGNTTPDPVVYMGPNGRLLDTGAPLLPGVYTVLAGDPPGDAVPEPPEFWLGALGLLLVIGALFRVRQRSM